MTTQIEIARELGLSKSTVSRALRGEPGISQETVDAVRRIAERDGYVPFVNASGLSTGRNHAIGVVVPALSPWFYRSVLSGIDDALMETDFDVVLFDLSRAAQDRGRPFHRSLLRRRVDALIVLSSDFTDDERIQLESVGMPLIAVGGPVEGMRNIGVDDPAIVRAATQHLLDLGHTDIGTLGGFDAEQLNTTVPTLRTKTFAAVLGEAGLALREEWMLDGGYRLGIAKERVAGLLADGGRLPTAFVCLSDEMAIGAICAFHAAGRSVPGDISIVGIDGHEYAEAFALTTCEQTPESQGIAAARQVIREIAGADPPERFAAAPFTLVERGSTAPPHR